VAYFEDFYQYLSGVTEERRENSQSECPAPAPRMEPDEFPLRGREALRPARSLIPLLATVCFLNC
jgi:hypothetical protein